VTDGIPGWAAFDYTKSKIVDELWRRPGLSKKDRYMVTLSTLISRMQTAGMLHYFNNALDDGVTPSEISETVTHLAFYAGWPTARLDDADRRLFHRDVEADIVLHGCPPQAADALGADLRPRTSQLGGQPPARHAAPKPQPDYAISVWSFKGLV
jgi:Carboxymuconolactone decarboxylase family